MCIALTKKSDEKEKKETKSIYRNQQNIPQKTHIHHTPDSDILGCISIHKHILDNQPQEER